MRSKTDDIFRGLLLSLLMACAGFYAAANWYVPEQEVPVLSPQASSSEKYTAEQFRTERQQLRAMQKAQINDILYNATADPETASMAQEQLLELLDREEKENTLEGLLEMRGFADPVVSVHKGSATIMISSEILTQQQSSIILDIVCRETGLLGGNIKIIPIK